MSKIKWSLTQEQKQFTESRIVLPTGDAATIGHKN